jgi:type IV pilus assembly protein PilW
MEHAMNHTFDTQRRQAGMTLIELMVALAIGSFLMIGAVTVYMESRTTFRVTESVARLQENARFALDRMEPDIRMANYWGLTTRPNKIQGRATPADPVAFPVANDCTVNFSVNVATPVGGANNIAGFPAVLCNNAFSLAAQVNTDTLVIRRVAEDPVAVPAAGRLYVQSARFQNSQIFIGPAVPAGYLAATSQTHQLIVNGYYVSQQSTMSTPGNPFPSLRMKTLRSVGGVPTIVDEEVLPGVEDMQVQYGIDTDAPGAANRGAIDRYVNAGDPLLNPVANPDVEILAVRLWLRVRAERLEVGFTDTADYVYADQNTPAFNDQFRRVVVSKTIYLRNARPPI